jgi:hypothetical protein
MLALPKGLDITRNYEEEARLLEKGRAYLDRGERDGIHASDLIDPRLAYFKRLKPAPLPDRLINMFLVGQALHAIVLCVMAGETDYTRPPDGGTRHFEGLQYSPDMMQLNGEPNEIKTTRSFYLPDKAYLPDDKTMHRYFEQLMIYMAAEDKITGHLTMLYLNNKDRETNRTTPIVVVFDIKTTQEALEAFRKQMLSVKDALAQALEAKDHRTLPLCRPFMCEGCEYFENDCKPEGRYGIAKKKDWTA